MNVCHESHVSVSSFRLQFSFPFRGALCDDDKYIVRFEARDSLIFPAVQGSAKGLGFWCGSLKIAVICLWQMRRTATLTGVGGVTVRPKDLRGPAP